LDDGEEDEEIIEKQNAFGKYVATYKGQLIIVGGFWTIILRGNLSYHNKNMYLELACLFEIYKIVY
jgi:hypothetical protein